MKLTLKTTEILAMVDIHNLKIEVHETLPSTNRYFVEALHQNKEFIPDGVIALRQSAGVGRVGRTWVSGEPNEVLTFSLKWSFSCSAERLSGMSLVVGLAVLQALSGLGIKNLKLKWPNDIFGEGKKLSGILIETIPQNHQHITAVIGIGLNLKLSERIKQHIDQEVTDLYSLEGKEWQAMVLLSHILPVLKQHLMLFNQQGFLPFRVLWQDVHLHQQESIRLFFSDGQEKIGTALGVDENGALCLQTELGIEIFSMGEVRLRAN